MPRLNPRLLIVCWILNLLGDRHALVFLFVDWNKVEHKLNSMKRRGKPDSYPRIQKFQILFWGYIHNTRSPTHIVRSVERNPLARLVLGWNIPSHDAITDCMKTYNPVMDSVFCMLRDKAIQLGIVQIAIQVEDPTSVATKFLSDKDAKWGVKKGGKKKKWYFGYGLNARIDPFSHLPISLLFTQSKKTNFEEIKELNNKSFLCELYLADSEFDIVEWIELLINSGALPVIPYNRRRYGKKGIKYRIQEYTDDVGVRWLKKASRLRAEIEHNWSTDKERFGLEDIHVKGWKKVETHTYMCMIARYADAFAVHGHHPEASVRQSFVTL